MQYGVKLLHEKCYKIIFIAFSGCVSIKTPAYINHNNLLNIVKQGLTIIIQSGIKSEKYGVENFNTRMMSVVSTHLHMAFEGFCHCKHHCLKHDSQPPTIQNSYAVVYI